MVPNKVADVQMCLTCYEQFQPSYRVRGSDIEVGERQLPGC